MSDKLRESMGSKGSKDLESIRLKAAHAQAELAYAETYAEGHDGDFSLPVLRSGNARGRRLRERQGGVHR